MSTAVQTKPMRLDPEFRQRWLDALRSGDYEGRECYGVLFNGANRCALGVGAEVAGEDPSREAEAYVALERLGVRGSRAWLEFDDNRLTFAQFADWLEANSEPKS